MTKRFSPAFSFKFADLSSKGEFRGVASTYGGAPDSFGDIIAPGAFSASLKKHYSRGTLPAMLFAHDMTEPIGNWISINETDKGLDVHGRLALTTQRGAEVYELMKTGGLTGLSVGILLAENGKVCRGDGCVIKEIDRLFEISVVPVPANENAHVTHVKSACGCNSIPELQKFFQESLGVSRSAARKMAFACSGIISEPDADDDMGPAEVAAVSIQLKKLNSIFERNYS